MLSLYALKPLCLFVLKASFCLYVLKTYVFMSKKTFVFLSKKFMSFCPKNFCLSVQKPFCPDVEKNQTKSNTITCAIITLINNVKGYTVAYLIAGILFFEASGVIDRAGAKVMLPATYPKSVK